MNYFNYLKALIIAAALVVLSAFTITTHAAEVEAEVETQTSPLENFVATPSKDYPSWSNQVWEELSTIAERMFELLPNARNYVERYPSLDTGNPYESSLVFEAKSNDDRSL